MQEEEESTQYFMEAHSPQCYLYANNKKKLQPNLKVSAPSRLTHLSFEGSTLMSKMNYQLSFEGSNSDTLPINSPKYTFI